MLNSLQACRATAAILVVLFHASGSIFALPKYFSHKPFGLLFDFGFAGVDFFFVLSGFIMMHIHAKDIGQPRAFGSYLWKRFSRIYPIHWIVLAAILPVFYLIPHFEVGQERDPGVIFRSVFLVPNSDIQLVLSVAWTSCTRFSFICCSVS
jgi:peptidoglycan/LPS O-acetylase OafA/YrhL